MKKLKYILPAVLCFCLIFTVFSAVSTANGDLVPLDFGDFGGGADYGGDDYGGDYGGGYDGDAGDLGDLADLLFVFAWLFDNPVFGFIALGIIFALITASVFVKKSHKKPVVTNVPRPTQQSMLRPMADYKALDPNFSSADMEAKISNIFIRLQSAWMKKDLSDVRTCLTDEFFAQTDRQLDSYRVQKTTNVVERIAVLGVSLTGWDQNDKNDILVARVSARMADYVISDTTGEIVRGSKTADKFMEYEWTLVRTKGKITGTDDHNERIDCPYCGAPLDINRTAKCEYCGNIVSTNDYDWCLASIKGLSQRTVEN